MVLEQLHTTKFSQGLLKYSESDSDHLLYVDLNSDCSWMNIMLAYIKVKLVLVLDSL